MKKLNVIVLMGGKSSEREISLLSGSEVLSNINKERYIVKPLEIPKKGNEWINKLVDLNPDLVFIALHGANGEDGSIQGMLDTLGIPYTGSGVLSSALGMDKILFKKIMRSENISIPKDVKSAPCFIKPNNEGSSVGASLVLADNKFNSAIRLAKKYSNDILIEEYLNGIELTCAVIGNENPTALPIIEILPKKGDFFNYKSKYTQNGSDEIVPARISKLLTKEVQDLAIKVYTITRCRGFARVDFILKENKYPVVLEINTIPGLTKMSLLPKAAKAANISYTDLLDKIINYAIE